MKRLSYSMSLTLVAPFLFRGLEAGRFGLDAAQMRDIDGSPILPADQARGVLKEALVDIAAAAPEVIAPGEIDHLFGLGSTPAGDDGEQDRPERGRISVSDLGLAPGQTPQRLDEPVVRVEIDDATGAARTGHIQFIEGVAPTGAELTFRGRLVVYWKESEAERIGSALAKAARLISAIGAYKSVGFGRVLCGEIAPEPASIPAAPAALPQDRLGLALRFDRPYLVDAARVVDNAFVGSPIVPGAVIKGALARKIELTGGTEALERLGDALSHLVITHAFPEDEAGRAGGERVPLSTVAIARKENGVTRLVLGDDLRLDGGIDGPGPFLDGEPATFPSDWKASWWDQAGAALGWAAYNEPILQPRTRTRIDEETGSAKDEALFTTVARAHRRPGAAQARRLLFTVDRCGRSDAAVTEILDCLCSGLDFIGKTDASATIEPWPEGDAVLEPRPVRGHPDLFAVRLRTAAVLVDPRTDASAFEAYAAYWQEAAGAVLVDFCAGQTLAGGYLATRRQPWPGTYHPFLLTEPGSIFLLRGDLSGRLRVLLRTGLPLPHLSGAQPPTWRNCPFVPGNGYGEIRADHLSGADFERTTRVERAEHG